MIFGEGSYNGNRVSAGSHPSTDDYLIDRWIQCYSPFNSGRSYRWESYNIVRVIGRTAFAENGSVFRGGAELIKI